INPVVRPNALVPARLPSARINIGPRPLINPAMPANNQQISNRPGSANPQSLISPEHRLNMAVPPVAPQLPNMQHLNETRPDRFPEHEQRERHINVSPDTVRPIDPRFRGRNPDANIEPNRAVAPPRPPAAVMRSPPPMQQQVVRPPPQQLQQHE